MKPKKEWTVMIYLAGDNNLSDDCIGAIKEMKRVGVNDKIAVVAQYDSVVPGVPVIRYEIGKADDSHGVLKGDALRKQGEGFVSATGLKDFALQCIRKYPAKHYLLVLSGHGSGVTGDAFLKDENPPRYLSIPRFRFALEQIKKTLGHKIDVLGLDACAMSMVEVGYELRGVVNYMVGAEGFEPNTGWPYDRILQTLNDQTQMNTQMNPAETLARTIVNTYVKYYTDYTVAGISVDHAACDLSHIETLAEGVNQLAQALRKAIRKDSDTAVLDALILAHWRAQSYKFEDYVDLWDFCDLLDRQLTKKVGDESDVRRACKAVKDAIGYDCRDTEGNSSDLGCVLKSSYSGAAYQHSHGLSIYFPWTEVSEKYKNLRFSIRTGWHRFLADYTKQTRRQPRGTGKLIPIPSADPSATSVRIISDYNRIISDFNRGDIPEPKVKNPPIDFRRDTCLD